MEAQTHTRLDPVLDLDPDPYLAQPRLEIYPAET